MSTSGQVDKETRRQGDRETAFATSMFTLSPYPPSPCCAHLHPLPVTHLTTRSGCAAIQLGAARLSVGHCHSHNSVLESLLGILSIIRGGCGRSPDRATVARSGDRPQRAILRRIEKRPFVNLRTLCVFVVRIVLSGQEFRSCGNRALTPPKPDRAADQPHGRTGAVAP